ncbi:hypothetical protein EV424DRAFT_1584703 [Suillus variegatus]|nr:hypothetical protein EV424DRAFT_1584703 [Suillus variegatus]
MTARLTSVKMVIAITALRKCELRIVQSSLIGSILSKLLLVLGMCFFAGGLRFSEQGFDQTATKIHSSLLSISVGALLLPAAYHFAISGGKDSGSLEQKDDILKMSYRSQSCSCLFWSHKHLYRDTKLKSSRLLIKTPVNSHYLTEMLSTSMTMNDKREFGPEFSTCFNDIFQFPNFPPMPRFAYRNSSLNSSSEVTLTESKEQIPEKGYTQRSTDALAEGVSQQQNTQAEHDHVDEPMTNAERANLHRSPSAAESFREPQLSWMVTLLLLTLVTITVSITAEDLVESMDGIETAISKQWVGLVLLPAVSSIAECVTAVNTSVKDQLNLSMSIAVGLSIRKQTTFLVILFMVTLGWIIGRPLALLFDLFLILIATPSEDIFGPVLTVITSDTLDDALDIINENKYGNGAVIFTQLDATARPFESGVNVGQAAAQAASEGDADAFSTHLMVSSSSCSFCNANRNGDLGRDPEPFALQYSITPENLSATYDRRIADD